MVAIQNRATTAFPHICKILKSARWRIPTTAVLSVIAFYFLLQPHVPQGGLMLSISHSLNSNKTSTTHAKDSSSIDIYPPPRPQPILPLTKVTEEYIAFCVAIKNQAFDLPEFLQHHYFHIGIKRYYIMDDGSTPPLADSLANTDWGGVPPSAVTFIYWSPLQRTPDMQHHLYNECVRVFGYRHTWMAFIDVDEFFEIESRSAHDIDRVLAQV
ncbi:unnamed protein product [Sphagnum balticum]